MNYSDYRFTLDIANTLQAQVSVPATFGDSARRLYIGLTEGRKPYTISDGCRVVFVARKPDGSSIFNDCIIENNKTIVYEFSSNTTSAEGVVDCEVRLYGTDGRLITSPQFIIVVDKRVLRDEEIPLSESEHTTLDRIILSEHERIEAEAKREAAYYEIKRLYGSNGIITLSAANWIDDAQTVTIPDVSEEDFVIFYPVSVDDHDATIIYSLYCDSEASGGEVIFRVLSMPEVDINLRYYVYRGKGGNE